MLLACLAPCSLFGATGELPSSRIAGLALHPGGLLPLAGASVSIHAENSKFSQTLVSDEHGEFVSENLPAGHYVLRAQKDGYADSERYVVDLEPASTAHATLTLGQSTAATEGSAKQDNGQTAAATQPSGSFFHRFFKAYHDDWFGPASTDPAPARRPGSWPAPVQGPPFPFSDWPIGGTVVIGTPFTQSGPLMQAIWSGKNGDAWKRSGVQIYGWLNFGGNWSTSKDTVGPNGRFNTYPESYDEIGNSIQPDQMVLYIERQPNTVQTDHFDWGFRVSGLWGLDYRFTTSKGWLSQQLLGYQAQGCPTKPTGLCNEYGFDPVMLYADFYVPNIAQGMDIRVGRYISLPDIEAQLAPNNYTFSHSLLYTVDCYTQTGLNTTTKINNNWTVQIGVSPGCDVAPWQKSDAKLTLNACVQYNWHKNADTLYFCENALNDGKYAYNNLNSLYLTWYHKFGESPWHTATEAWYQYEKQTPNVCYNSSYPNCGPGPVPTETNANGAFCKDPTQVTCFAPDYAVVNYIERQFGPHNYISIRNEFMDDLVGQRTGTKTRYTESLFGWGHWVGTSILFRPEVRFEHSYDRPAYDNYTKKSQLTLASDVIFFF